MQAAPETLKEQLTRVNAELAAAGRPDSFYTSLAASWARYGSLTERQEAALVRSLAQRTEREARRATENAAVTAPMPTGRVVISGEIVSTKWQENRFGGALKMLVRTDAGWKVYGTVPASISGNDALKGCRVTFTAQVESKEPSFGFFSRPTNARLLEAAQPEPIPAEPVAGPVRPARGPAGTLDNATHFNGHAPALVVRPADIACTNKPVFAAPAPAGKLADIIARAKEIEARREAADLASGGLASEYWDTDSMTQAEREREAADDRRFEQMAYGDRD